MLIALRSVMTFPSAVLLCGAAAIGVGCGHGKQDHSPGASDGTGGEGRGTGGAGTGTAGSGGTSSSGGGGGGASGSGVGGGSSGGSVAPFCAADFPCFGRRWWCVDATHYYRTMDHDCHFLCGPGPCSGGSCDPDGDTIACPAGTECAQQNLTSADAGVTSADGQPCRSPDGGQPDGSVDAGLRL
jgi:hypothetical protein